MYFKIHTRSEHMHTRISDGRVRMMRTQSNYWCAHAQGDYYGRDDERSSRTTTTTTIVVMARCCVGNKRAYT